MITISAKFVFVACIRIELRNYILLPKKYPINKDSGRNTPIYEMFEDFCHILQNELIHFFENGKK